MAYVESAATFVCAVLEQAGYYAQSLFLDAFRDFFREGGAFVYVLAACGAVFSVALHGSFRAARYLLVGPALFWFMLGPRTDYDGVIWKVGGGTARGLQDRRGEDASRQDVREVLKNAGLQEQPIRVASGFALFTRAINEIVGGIVDVMLNDEDGEYLMHLSRTRALDYVMSAVPYDPTLMEMMEGDLISKCPEFTQYGLGLAARDMQPEVIQALGPAATVANRRRAYYTQQFETYADSMFVEPNATTRRVMQKYAARVGLSPTQQKVTCRQMWQLMSEYLQDHAEGIVKKILELAKGDGNETVTACQFLIEKLGTGRGLSEGACQRQLKNAVSCYMVKNAILDRRGMSRFIRRMLNDREASGGFPSGFLVPLASLPRGAQWGHAYGPLDARTLSGVNVGVQFMMELMGMSGTPTTQQQMATFRVRMPGGPEDGGNPAGETYSVWTPVARLMNIGSSFDASFGELPKYNLRELRQRLFSWALNMPYWQGVILYFLAVLYPFFCMVLLVPSKAPMFFNLPLAWLWAKSWDIGMAAVMVFDRILWNIFPHAQLSEEVRNTPLQQLNFFIAITETMKGNQAWNLNLHYMLLSMATLSIPVISGAVILKARRAMLSSFTDKLISDVKSAGSMLSGAYGTQVMQDRVRAMREFGALAAAAMGDLGKRPAVDGVDFDSKKGQKGGFEVGGLLGDGRHERALFFGMLGSATAGFKLQVPAKGSLASFGADQLRGGAAFFRAYGTILDAEIKHDRAWRMAFDPVFGRWGEIRKRMQAFAAAADKSGGFEIDDYTINAHEEFIDLFSKKFDMMLGAAASFGRGLGVAGQYAQSRGTVADALGKFVDMLDVSAGVKKGDAPTEGKQLLASFVEPLHGIGLVNDKDRAAAFLADALHLTPAAWKIARGEQKYTYEGPGVSVDAWMSTDVNGNLYTEKRREGMFGFGEETEVTVQQKRKLTEFEMKTQFWMVEDMQGGEKHFRFEFNRVPEPQLFWDISGKKFSAGNNTAATQTFDIDTMVPSLHGYYRRHLDDRASAAMDAAEKAAPGSKGRWDAVLVAGTKFEEAVRQNPNMSPAEFQRNFGGLYVDYQKAAQAYWDGRTDLAGDKKGGPLSFDDMWKAARWSGPADFAPPPDQRKKLLENEQAEIYTGYFPDYQKALREHTHKQMEAEFGINWRVPLSLDERKAAATDANTYAETWFKSMVEVQVGERKLLETTILPLHIGPAGFRLFPMGRQIPLTDAAKRGEIEDTKK